MDEDDLESLEELESEELLELSLDFAGFAEESAELLPGPLLSLPE